MAIRRIKKEEDNIVLSIKGSKKITKYEKINVKQQVVEICLHT